MYSLGNFLEHLFNFQTYFQLQYFWFEIQHTKLGLLLFNRLSPFSTNIKAARDFAGPYQGYLSFFAQIFKDRIKI